MKKLLPFLTFIFLSFQITFAQVPQNERDALIAFYNATGGANWTNNTNWNTATPVSTWSGVTTGFNDLNGQPFTDGLEHVYSIIFFSDNNLVGTLPDVFSDLPKFRALILRYNIYLTGEIPSSIWSLTDMLQIQLMDADMSGEIPETISNLTNLQVLDIRQNNFSGQVPNALSSLTNLIHINIGNNLFSGTFPDVTALSLNSFLDN